jgi:hypothetical protein
MEKKFVGILDFWFTWCKKFAVMRVLKKRVKLPRVKPMLF